VAVVGERRQLVSAMHALLENAITYSYDNSSITVLGEAVEEVPLDPVPPSVGAPPPPPPPPSFVTGAEKARASSTPRRSTRSSQWSTRRPAGPLPWRSRTRTRAVLAI